MAYPETGMTVFALFVIIMFVIAVVWLVRRLS